MAEEGLGGELVRNVLSVVDEHVGISGQGQRVRVARPQAVGALTHQYRAVVGDVGDRGRWIGDPIAEHAARQVGDLQGEHVEARHAVVAGFEGVKAPVPSKLVRAQREGRRREHASENLDGIALRGDVYLYRATRALGRREERQAQDVVEMDVTEKDRAHERLGPEHG